MQQLNDNPQMDILKYSVEVLTNEWSDDQKQEFAKKCFDEVCIERYNTRRRVPTLNIEIIEQ